jgi:tRNA A37 threonylcarbamoyladenosine modification protein TsaB
VGARLVAVPSIHAIAWRALTDGRGLTETSILLDAHGGAFYHARFALSDSALVTLCEPELLPAAELEQALPEGGDLLVLDDDSQRAKLPAALRERVLATRPPDAGVLLELGKARFEQHGPDDPLSIEPLYLRPFAARTRRR